MTELGRKPEIIVGMMPSSFSILVVENVDEIITKNKILKNSNWNVLRCVSMIV